jgi:hypothetical protein
MKPYRTTASAFPKSARQKMADTDRTMAMYTPSGMAIPTLGPPLPPNRAPRKPATESLVPLEKDVQKTILAFLRHHPRIAFAGRFNSGAIVGERLGKKFMYKMNTIAGFPDLHAMTTDGMPIYFEVKRAGQNASDEQQSFLDLAAKHGAIACVVRSIEDVREALRKAWLRSV